MHRDSQAWLEQRYQTAVGDEFETGPGDAMGIFQGEDNENPV